MATIPGDEHTRALCTQVGALVVWWGGAEQTLTAIVTLLYKEYGGRRLPKVKRHPVLLKPKLDFVERCIHSMHELEPVKDDLSFIVTEFRRLSAIRHDVIHGAIASLTPEGTRFRFMKLDHDDPHTPTAREFHFDASHLGTILDDITKLNGVSLKIADWLIEPLRRGERKRQA
jgi:hypothetical protein